MHTRINKTSAAPLCNHIFPDDHQCGSPALRGQSFCYFHHPGRQPHRTLAARARRRGFNLSMPTNRREHLHALSEVIRNLAAGRIDPRRADVLLYALQQASLAWQTTPPQPPPAPAPTPSPTAPSRTRSTS